MAAQVHAGMTDAILQSDIDLAQSLLEANHSASEVVAALTRRGIEPGRATQVVEDLRCGKRVTPEPGLVPELAPVLNAAGAAPSAVGGQESGLSPDSAGSTEEEPGDFGFSPEIPMVRLWILAGLLGLAAVTGGGWLVAQHSYHAQTGALLDELEGVMLDAERSTAVMREYSPLPGTSLPDLLPAGMERYRFQGYCTLTNRIGRRDLNRGEEARLQAVAARMERMTRGMRGPLELAAAPPAPGSLELQIRPDGLHLGRSLLTRQSALGLLCRVLGAPTRTNRIARPSRIVYAFDRYGLLLYAQEGAGADSVVVDWDALGGTNGTLSAFTGTLKIEGQVIRADLDCKALAANRSLALTNSGTEGGILAGRRCGLGLYFAYLGSLHRLSLVEVDLK